MENIFIKRLQIFLLEFSLLQKKWSWSDYEGNRIFFRWKYLPLHRLSSHYGRVQDICQRCASRTQIPVC
jgi:hypothetical protein